MVRLRVLDILKEQNHTKYWLYKQMDLSYQNREHGNNSNQLHLF